MTTTILSVKKVTPKMIDEMLKDDDKECDFCGKKGDWKNILRDTNLEKKDGSDIILCDDCINLYAHGDYDKIKLKSKQDKLKLEIEGEKRR